MSIPSDTDIKVACLPSGHSVVYKLERLGMAFTDISIPGRTALLYLWHFYSRPMTRYEKRKPYRKDHPETPVSWL
jgi:hypothetical protein